jgi:hypothetical protein
VNVVASGEGGLAAGVSAWDVGSPVAQTDASITTEGAVALVALEETPQDPPDAPREAAAQASFPVSRAVLLAVAIPVLLWLALMTAIAVAAGSGLDAIAAGGWRIVAYRDISVAAFALALLASVAAILVIEARARRPRE